MIKDMEIITRITNVKDALIDLLKSVNSVNPGQSIEKKLTKSEIKEEEIVENKIKEETENNNTLDSKKLKKSVVSNY